MERMRRMLFAVLLAGVGGTLAELLLTSHTEQFWQKFPVALLAGAVPVILLAAFRPGRWAVAAMRTAMALFIAAGLLGTWFHYESNAEFAMEITPGLSGFELLAEAFTRATPPPLAPGTMIMLGLVGFICCYRIRGSGSGHTPDPAQGV
jgi:hypothetical protein